MRKVMFATVIESFTEGRSFSRSSWPIHVTLVPWFKTSGLDELDKELIKLQKRHRPILACVGQDDNFGPKRNVPVSIIEAGPELQHLHEDLVNVAKSVGVIESEKFLGSAFTPHVRRYRDRRLQKGEELEFSHFELVELLTPKECKIIKSYDL